VLRRWEALNNKIQCRSGVDLPVPGGAARSRAGSPGGPFDVPVPAAATRAAGVRPADSERKTGVPVRVVPDPECRNGAPIAAVRSDVTARRRRTVARALLWTSRDDHPRDRSGDRQREGAGRAADLARRRRRHRVPELPAHPRRRHRHVPRRLAELLLRPRAADPTSRWSVFDCQRAPNANPTDCAPGGKLNVQIAERAWTSPI
jgi:hypothetical protein